MAEIIDGDLLMAKTDMTAYQVNSYDENRYDCLSGKFLWQKQM